MKTPRFSRSSKGQAMFILILALPVIVGVLTLVMDVGNLYYNQVSMQVAVDSGVLSGAHYLPS
jgi:Flp pilus assembly protein TadG